MIHTHNLYKIKAALLNHLKSFFFFKINTIYNNNDVNPINKQQTKDNLCFKMKRNNIFRKKKKN